MKWRYFIQCLPSFLSIDRHPFICVKFLMLFTLAQIRVSQLTHMLMLKTLTSIIRTGWHILVELIDLVICYNFLSKTIVLRLLVFLPASLTVTSLDLLFLIFFCEASISSTVAFLLLGSSDHVIISTIMEFPFCWLLRSLDYEKVCLWCSMGRYI